MRFFIASAITCAIFFAFSPTYAQTSDEVIAQSGVPVESVAAVVNDKVITTFDVRQRIKLMVISAGGRIPTDALPQLQQQAMRDLIEEKLKLQEAEKFKVDVSDSDIQKELDTMAAQSNLSFKDLSAALEESGISINSLKEQIKASIAWPEIIQGRFRDRVRINDDEIEDTLARMREDLSNTQYLISEICIPVADASQTQRYYQGALQLIEQMRKGVPFSVVAQQFSACTSAAVGGDMGWVRAGELPPDLDSAIRNLQPGSVTNPIPSEGAFMILAVRDKREAVVAGEPTFTLAYAAANASIGENAARLAFQQLSSLGACSGRALRVDPGKGVGVTLLEHVTLDSVDPRFRDMLKNLQRGDTSALIEADGAYHAVYVCDIDEGLGLPSRDSLEARIYNRQLSRIGQQYLRDLEHRSMVDIRLKEPIFPNG